MKNDPIVEDARKARIAFAARHGVPEVWVIDLENALVHFHRRPGGGMYTTFPPRSAPA